MGVLLASTPSTDWQPEDDVLLRTAIEHGASLESLAKGAIVFSRKFTLQEIESRWDSLLYDTEVATQACSRMAELEEDLFTSDPAMAHKLFNTKAKGISLKKRKINSVKSLYNAARKRVRNDWCNSADLRSHVASCSCKENGIECACGGLLKLSQGHHMINNMVPGLGSVSSYGEVSASYNGGHIYPEMNGHSYHTKHPESIVKNGDVINNNPYRNSDIGQIYDHAYAAKDHGNTEGNNVSIKSSADFQDSMQLQQLDSDQCGNGLAESKTLVIPISGQMTGQPESYQVPGSAVWSRVQERVTFTLADDKKVKSENRDTFPFQANLDDGICTSGIEHPAIPEHDFIDTPFFNSGEEFDILNGEIILNSPSKANREDLDDPASKVVPGVRSTMQNLAHPDEDMPCDQIDAGHVNNDVVDVSAIILVPTSLEVPCPGHYVECVLNTEDPEIPCNDDPIPGEYPLQCSPSTGQVLENTIRSFPPSTSSPLNAECSKASDLAQNNGEDLKGVQPSSKEIKLSPSDSEQKEGSVALGGNPSEAPSAAGVLLTGNTDTNDANTCMLALPSFSAAGFGEGSPCGLEQERLTLADSVQAPDQMQYNLHDNQPELAVEAALQNCTPPNALSNLGFQEPVATVPIPAQAEECSDDENDVPNFYDVEALILDQDLIPEDHDSDLMLPEVTRFQLPETRKSLIRLEQGARSHMNRAIMSHGAFAVIYGSHLKYYIKDPEVTLGRETEDVKVDVDLGKEGRANKISRRQAVIKMDETGCFHITNIGKCPIFVNSKEILSCKRINLSSDSVIEIKEMKLMFHVNQDAVKQYISREVDLDPEP